MILFFLFAWAFLAGVALYVEHLVWDNLGELERYVMGTATLLGAFSGWTVSLVFSDLMLIWQDVLIAAWGIAGAGGVVIWAAHAADLRRLRQRDRHQHDEPPPPYPSIDQDL